MKKLIGHLNVLTGVFTPLEGTHDMAKQAKKEEQKVAVIENLPAKLTPATVVGVSTNIAMNPDLLPDEFKGVEMEVVQSGFNPSVKWEKKGDFVGGIYTGLEQGVGPNKAMLYNFETKSGKPFSVWGTKALDRAMSMALEKHIITPGRLVMITLVDFAESDYEGNPTKLFHIQVGKK